MILHATKMKESATGPTSRKDNCWDDAPTESFLNSPKNVRMQGTRYGTRAEAAADLFHYIDLFYNRKHRHSTPRYTSPQKFPEDWISTQHKRKLAA